MSSSFESRPLSGARTPVRKHAQERFGMLLDATESPLADSGNEDVSLAQIAEMAGHAAGIARLHVDLADISLHLLNKLMSRSVSFESLAWMPVVPSHLGDNIVEFSVTGSALPTCCPLLPIPT